MSVRLAGRREEEEAQVIELLTSGGQTGVDRAALDFAIAHGIPHGGWCPKGRVAEDGIIPPQYQLKESFSSAYPPRTEANVLDSNATAIFVVEPLNEERGCLLTAALCLKHKKPYVVINLKTCDEAAAITSLRALVAENDVRILNVAGARGSRKPDLGKFRRIMSGAILEKV